MSNLARNSIMELQRALEAAPAVSSDMREFTDHFFAPGIYLRTLFIPRGHVVVGAYHKNETINILLKGKISVTSSTGENVIAKAPYIFVAKPGQKAGYAIEDVWYANVFPNNEDITNIKQLELEHTTETLT